MLAVGLTATTVLPAGAAEGEGGAREFVVVCAFDHAAGDDPIVNPGQAGATHRHDFFGAPGVNANTTNGDLRTRTTNCGLPEDRSAYWLPALKVDGQWHRPDHLKVYYTDIGEGSVQPFPENLRIVAGDAQATSRQSVYRTSWRCKTPDFHQFAAAEADPLRCPSGYLLVLTVHFPECSNGQADSPDHKSHMSFAIDGVCPAGFYRVPKLTLHAHYRTRGGSGAVLSSPTGVESQHSAHADFMNGWRTADLQAEMTRCFRYGQCTVFHYSGYYYTTPVDENQDRVVDGTDEEIDNNPTPPSWTQSPTITGTPQVGRRLTASAAATGTPEPTIYYAWRRCNWLGCTQVGYQQGYTVQRGDVGSQLQVVATAKSRTGTISILSSRTAKVTL